MTAVLPQILFQNIEFLELKRICDLKCKWILILIIMRNINISPTDIVVFIIFASKKTRSLEGTEVITHIQVLCAQNVLKNET